MGVARTVRRRSPRRTVALVVLLAVIGAVVAWIASPRSVHSAAVVVIVPPPAVETSTDAGNPLLGLDGNLARLAVVLATTMRSEDASRALVRQDASASYSITADAGPVASSPQLVFAVTGSSTQRVHRTAAALISVARDQLDTLQTRLEVPGSARATLLETVAPQESSDDDLRWRAAGIVAAGVLILGLLAFAALSLRPQQAVSVVSRPSTRRQRRLDERRAIDPDAVVPPRSR